MKPLSEWQAEDLKRHLGDFFLSPTNQCVLLWQIPPDCTRLLQFFMTSVNSGLRNAMEGDVRRGYYSKRPLNHLERRVRRLEEELNRQDMEKRSTTDVDTLLHISRERTLLIDQIGKLEKEVQDTPRGLFARSARPSYNMFISGIVLQMDV